MALNVSSLEKDIITIIKSNTKSGDEGVQYFAQQLAKAIDEYIKSGTVIVQPGPIVTSQGPGSIVSPLKGEIT